MPVIQITETEDGFEGSTVDLSARPVDKVTLLVRCWGDERMDASPLALVEIDREGARGILAKLKACEPLAKEFDMSFSSARFFDYRPEFFDGGVLYTGDDLMEVIGDEMDNEQILLLTPDQVEAIRALLPKDSYRWIRGDCTQLCVDPPRAFYWRSCVKHTDLHMETQLLGRDILKELAGD